MAHIVHCRICKKEIDIDSTHDWVMPSTNYYYHTSCYDSWIQRKGDRSLSTERTAEEWFDLLKDYIYRDIKIPHLDWSKISSQWRNFLKTKNFTPKGIYFAVIYFYEIQKGNVELAKGGIGIVSNIYYEAAQYWANLEAKRKGTLEGIVKQMIARQNRTVINVVDVARRNGPKVRFSLDDIGEEEDDG